MSDRPEYCGTYCEHNAAGECDCQPCVFIRTETGFEHAPGCPYGAITAFRDRDGWHEIPRTAPDEDVRRIVDKIITEDADLLERLGDE